MFIASGETPHLLARYVVTLTQHLQRLQEPCCRVSAARQGTDASPTRVPNDRGSLASMTVHFVCILPKEIDEAVT